MSKKITILNLLKTMNNEWLAADKEMKGIYDDGSYTLEFKDRKAEEIRLKLNVRLEQIKVMIAEAVDKKLEDLFKPSSNTFDAAYQSRLTNVLSIVELAGSDIDLRDLKSMIEPFNKDYTALQAIRAAITAAGIDQQKDYPDILSFLATGALEDRQETHRKLVKFKSSLNGFTISGNVEWLKGSNCLGYDGFFDSFDDELNFVSNKSYGTKKIEADIQ